MMGRTFLAGLSLDVIYIHIYNLYKILGAEEHLRSLIGNLLLMSLTETIPVQVVSHQCKLPRLLQNESDGLGFTIPEVIRSIPSGTANSREKPSWMSC